MTLNFAKQEADRRTAVLHRSHYVIESRLILNIYLVVDRLIPGRTVVYASNPKETK